MYKCVELAFFRALSCCFVLKDELPSHLLKTLSDTGCSCWLAGKDPRFSARRVRVNVSVMHLSEIKQVLFTNSEDMANMGETEQ